MPVTRRFACVAAALFILPTLSAGAAELGGSPASMVQQHAVAVKESYSFLRTPTDVAKLVTQGALVPVASAETFSLSNVRFPVARTEVRQFIERFAQDFRDSTGATLVVTSLTRPAALQPRNAHKLSVHPAGMAVDFRVPASPEQRAYLERALLRMERSGLLDATRERSPAHYHVAVFPSAFGKYAAVRDSADAVTSARLAALAAARAAYEATARVARQAYAASEPDAGNVFAFLLAMALLAGASLIVLRQPRQPRRARARR